VGVLYRLRALLFVIQQLLFFVWHAEKFFGKRGSKNTPPPVFCRANDVLPTPKGFPPSADDLRLLTELAEIVGSAFRSPLIVADFVRDRAIEDRASGHLANRRFPSSDR
jgi:hypothetical protein